MSHSPSLEETGSHYLAGTSHTHQLQVSYERSFNKGSFYCPEAGNSWKTLSERTLLLLSERCRSFRRPVQLASKALMFPRKRGCELHQVVWTDCRADSLALTDDRFLSFGSFACLMCQIKGKSAKRRHKRTFPSIS